MNTRLTRLPMTTSGRRRIRGGAWLYVLTLAVVVASFGTAVLLILRTP